MSQHRTLEATDRGSIEQFSGCAGRFIDVFDSQGRYLATVATIEQAKAMIKAE